MMLNNPNNEEEDVSMYYPDGDAEHIARDDHDEAFLNQTIKKKKKIRRKNARLKKSQITMIVTIFVIYALVLVVAAWMIFYKPAQPTPDELPFDTTPMTSSDPNNPPLDNQTEGQGTNAVVNNDEYKVKDGVYNILVIGHDDAALLADVTMIVNIDTVSNTITVMQIPRDTFVSGDIPTNKVNAAFSTFYSNAYDPYASDSYDEALTSAMKEYEKMFEQSLCINIHHTAVINLAGFQSIINILGGVSLYVPSAMQYSDPEQNLYIDIPAGYQTLDGYQAECFVRFRMGYVQADLGRVNAQKIFLTALFNQVKATVKSVNVSTLTQLAGEVIKYLHTDLTASDIMFYAKALLNIDLENINMMTLPGNVTGAYFVVNRAATLEAINQYFNIYEKEISDSIFDRNFTFNLYSDEWISASYYADSDVIYDGIYNAQSIDEESIYIPRT